VACPDSLDEEGLIKVPRVGIVDGHKGQRPQIVATLESGGIWILRKAGGLALNRFREFQTQPVLVRHVQKLNFWIFDVSQQPNDFAPPQTPADGRARQAHERVSASI